MKRSAHPHVAKPRFIAESYFISEASSCAAGALHSKKPNLSVDKLGFFVGWDGWVRTIEMPESKSGALPLGYIPIFDCLCIVS